MSESEQCEKASRQAWWSEIDSDEKIKRLREKIKRLDESMSGVRRQIFRLNKHIHGADGELLQRMLTQNDDEGPYLRDKGGDDIYF